MIKFFAFDYWPGVTLKFFLVLIFITSLNVYCETEVDFISKLNIIFKSQEITPSENDKKIALIIGQIFNNNKPELTLKLVKENQKNIQSNPKFSPFNNWTTNILNCLKQTDTVKIISSIEEISIGTHKLEKSLHENFLKTCHEHLLGNLLKSLNSSDKLDNEKVKNYFVSKIIEMTSSNTLVTKTAALLKLIKNKKSFNFINDEINKTYVSKKQVPPEEIIKVIQVSSDLTGLIQKQGMPGVNLEIVYLNYLDDLIKKINNTDNQLQLNSLYTDLDKFFSLNKNNISSKRGKSKLIILAKDLGRNNRYEESSRIFSLLKADTDLELAHESLFGIINNFIALDKSKDAFLFIEKEGLLNHFYGLNSKLKYWIAHTCEINGKRGLSEKLYTQIIEDNPLTYYAIISSKHLKKMNNSLDEHDPQKYFNSKIASGEEIGINNFSEDFLNDLIRLRLWDYIGHRELSKLEFFSINEEGAQYIKAKNFKLSDAIVKENAIILTAFVFSLNNNYIYGFNIIQQALLEGKIYPNTTLLKVLFPTLYLEEIKKLDTEIDPIILLALIRQESGFNPKAKSLVGARGLMQLMPQTAKQLNRRVKAHELEKPDTNLKLGIQYFKYLCKRYDNNLVYVLSAYNAGERRVDRWQKEIFKSDNIVHNIEQIPFQETRDYVKLIFRNMYFYKTLIASQTTDSHDPNQIYDINLGFKR